MVQAMRWRLCETHWRRRGRHRHFLDIKNRKKARPLNPFLSAKSDKLKKLITEVRIKFEEYEHSHQIRKRARRRADQRTFERMIEAIVCNLCLVHLDNQNEAVHLPLTNKVLGKASRYKSPVLGKTLPSILNIMTEPEMALASLTKGHKTFRIIDQHLNVAPAEGVQSTLEPGPWLVSRIKSFEITPDDIGESSKQEPLVLRAQKRVGEDVPKELEYSDTDATHKLRQEIQDINAWLAAADISCDYPDINPNFRYLRRIFNNGSFKEGGRLYGGFWQHLNSDTRAEHIRINRDVVVECDYGQMSLLLLYAQAHAQDQIPTGDLYDLSAFGIPTDFRRGIKKVVQTIINSPELPQRLPKGARKHIPRRFSCQDIVKSIEGRHNVIFPLMTSGIGMQLFRKESDILVAVLMKLKEQGIVALPVHDAVIVADEDKEQTQTTMKEVFKEHTGITPEVSLM